MKLSNKKLKYIARHASEKTPEEIAGDLRIRTRDVEKALNISPRKTRVSFPAITDGAFRWGLMAVTFCAPFILVRGLYDFVNLPQAVFIQTGVTVLCLLWLIHKLISGSTGIVRSPFNLPVLAFILWSFVSLLYAHNKWEGTSLFMHWSACALMYFLVLNGTRGERDAARLLAVVYAAGVLTSVLGIGQHLLGIKVIPQVIPPAATFANKNMAVHFVILSLPLAAGFVLGSTRPFRTWITSITAALMVAFLIYSKTKAGWVALAMEAILLAVLVVRQYQGTKRPGRCTKSTVAALCVSLGITLLLINLGPRGFTWTMGGVAEQASAIMEADTSSEDSAMPYSSKGLRLDIWLNTVEMIKDRPLIGYGIGNHKVYYPLYHRKRVTEKVFSETSQLHNVHNDFLQIFAETGLVGILLLAWLAVAFIRVAWNLTKRERPPATRFMAVAAAVGTFGLLINSCFSFPLERAIPPFVVMIYVGILGALFHTCAPRRPAVLPGWATWTAAVVVVCTGIWLAWLYDRVIDCDRHYLLVSHYEKVHDWKRVIREAEAAYALNPARGKTLSYLGRANVELGNHTRAIELLTRVLDAYPYHMNALLNIGVSYSSMEQYDKALDAYRRALEIKPTFAKAHNNIANIHMKRKDVDAALEEFTIASKLDPENGLIHFNVGVVQVQKKRYEEAMAAFARAVELKPDWAEAHKNLGIAYTQFLRNPRKGIPHLKKAIELNPAIKDGDRIREIIAAYEKHAQAKP